MKTKLSKSKRRYLEQLEELHKFPALVVCMAKIEESSKRVDHLRFLGAPVPIIEQARETRDKWKSRLLDAMFRETEL